MRTTDPLNLSRTEGYANGRSSPAVPLEWMTLCKLFLNLFLFLYVLQLIYGLQVVSFSAEAAKTG